MSGVFGYTRGKTEPGQSTLKPYRDRSGNFVVYADTADTEALLVRLAPQRVVEWLRSRGFPIEPEDESERSVRLAILNACQIPDRGEDIARESAGSALLTLVHSYADRFIRRASVFAGIDRNALSELLVPSHLSFFVFLSARGDFVLGGLQAVFETELGSLLDDVVEADHRCALDPGCRRSGAACSVCLHLGEPSCPLLQPIPGPRSPVW